MAKKDQSHRKPNLAALFRVLGYFMPEMDHKGTWTGKFLVNQRTKLEGDPPDRDQLLHMIGLASIELNKFMMEHDEVCKQHSNSLSSLMCINGMIGQMIDVEDMDAPIHERCSLVKDRYKQLYQVLHNIAYNLPTERAKEVAARFLEGNKKLALVNQKGGLINDHVGSEEVPES